MNFKPLNVLVACEYSGIVRDAFVAAGHYAMSVDILDTESLGNHYKGDIRDILNHPSVHDWDLMIAHPPCTHLASSGARWWKDKDPQLQADAIELVKTLLEAPIPYICLENPVGVLSTALRLPDQIIQPWQFGESKQKTTCLWFKNLPTLTPTEYVDRGEFVTTKKGKKVPKWYNIGEQKDRGKIRSKFFPGVAKAMAEQWGYFIQWEKAQKTLGGLD